MILKAGELYRYTGKNTKQGGGRLYKGDYVEMISVNLPQYYAGNKYQLVEVKLHGSNGARTFAVPFSDLEEIYEIEESVTEFTKGDKVYYVGQAEYDTNGFNLQVRPLFGTVELVHKNGNLTINYGAKHNTVWYPHYWKKVEKELSDADVVAKLCEDIAPLLDKSVTISQGESSGVTLINGNMVVTAMDEKYFLSRAAEYLFAAREIIKLKKNAKPVDPGTKYLT